MNLIPLSRQLNHILQKLPFEQLANGFHSYRFALYNNSEICLEEKLFPYDNSFMGNTAKFYDGEYIAIWNIELSSIKNPYLLASSLVHEMFHCHQYSCGEKRFPSELTLLHCPEKLSFFLQKYQEDLLLIRSLEDADPEAFRLFFTLRNRRLTQYPDFVAEELKAETIEGFAEFVGIKALKLLDPTEFQAAVQNKIDSLKEQSEKIFDIRKRAYDTGTLFCLCLEQFGYPVKNDLSGKDPLYLQNKLSFDQPQVSEINFDTETLIKKLSLLHQNVFKNKQNTLRAHLSDARYVPCKASVCGYDPMNMFRLKDRIYCSRFVCLRKNGEVITMTCFISS